MTGAESSARAFGGPGALSNARVYKREFWAGESPKFSVPHYRLNKSARLINAIAGSEARTLLDIGCGPATLRRLLRPNIRYHGIDIAVPNPAPYLLETDLLEQPVAFCGRRFDIVVALGVFEYLGDVQDQKFAEIAALLNDGGTFLVSYTNFGHRRSQVYSAVSNVQPIECFQRGLQAHFEVVRVMPASHNWSHSQPRRMSSRAINWVMAGNIPVVSPLLAVEYFFVCSGRRRVVHRRM